MTEPTLQLEDTNLARVVFGEKDRHIDQLERALAIQILVRGSQLTFRGAPEKCQLALRIVRELYDVVKRGYPLKAADVEISIRLLGEDPSQSLADIFLDQIGVSARHQHVTPKTRTQKAYIDAIRTHDIVFSWGPAGTGKTYLAMAMAVSALLAKQIDRIILTRPAVEAGEKLGFLPGDLAEKVNPYLRPLYDALHDMMEFEKAQKLVERGVIEVAPLAFMRGRTLNNAFVILDEAQNTTSEQMKMFLTRLGFDSKAVITGDITQIDLPGGRSSGLVEALDLLKSIDGIAFVRFTDVDVVRHPLVQRIVRAYEAAENPRG
jgi:phosphate starvation-inducible protein PhoH and related proteins